MGKIKIRKLGDEAFEEAQKRKIKEKRVQKKLVHLAGFKGGQRIKAVGPTEEEIEKELEKKPKVEKVEEVGKVERVRKEGKKKSRSKKYKEALGQVDRNKLYPLKEAVSLLKKISYADFDETVEIHLIVLETGLRGNIVLPHGTGKKVKVVIADDKIIENVSKGKIDFDILVAHPKMMPKIAKVARFLGPRGLMPNPKAGTISEKPEELVKKLSAGQTQFKTEVKAPLIHQVMGKLSFPEEYLIANIKAFLQAVGPHKIQKAVLKSTMSPGIKLDLTLSS